ncbi:hypothetical protein CVD19_13960 [Bacillus sp. T33-2]|nr:hypothetical protein CVD19_13960 [Bacillus sp. T33-2]
MYEYELVIQARLEEIERAARDAWKYQSIPKDSFWLSLIQRFSSSKNRMCIPAKECNCNFPCVS